MAHLRFNLDLALPMPLPQQLVDALPTIREKIRQLKAYAVRINEGQENEEASVRAVFHVCHHEDGVPCEEEEDV